MNAWSTYVQNPQFLEYSRKHRIPPEQGHILAEHLHLKEQDKLLDIGTGTGYWCRLLLDSAPNIQGFALDFDQNFVDYATNNFGNYGIQFTQGDGTALPYDDQQFDHVTSHTFLSSVHNPKRALEEQVRVCKEGGFVSGVVPLSLHSGVTHSGSYPAECQWARPLEELKEKIHIACQAVNPLLDYVNKMDLTRLPHLFAEVGLQDVTAYPLGKLFSLSNANISPEERNDQITTMISAETERLKVYGEKPLFRRLITEKEETYYLSLLQEKAEYYRAHPTENMIWELDSSLNMLVVAQKTKATSQAQAKPVAQDYGKCKDRAPEETLAFLKGKLEEIGIEVEEHSPLPQWEGCYSNRIAFKGTDLGSNGKGTEPLYTLASGYAELFERMQNNLLSMERLPETEREFFDFYPEEKYLSLEEIIESNSSFLQSVLKDIGVAQASPAQKKAVMEKLFPCEEKEGSLLCVPFVSYGEKKLTWIPFAMAKDIYGTNGMAAGNTREEAMVQGLCEIFERYACGKIATGEVVPPEIPRSYLENYPSLCKIIDSIQESGKYQVVLRDCSLGRGLPVVCCVILNLETGTFGVRFGSHLSFPVAIERTFTEAFQGKNLEQFSQGNMIGSKEVVLSFDNLPNIFKMGAGYYDAAFLTGEASYPFAVAEDKGPTSNKEMLEHCYDILEDFGLDLLVHDSSYLGLPSYMIIVPEMSEIYPFTPLRSRERTSATNVMKIFADFPEISPENLEKVARFLKFKENSLLENQLSCFFDRPVPNNLPGGLLSNLFFLGCCDYQLGKLEQAHMAFRTCHQTLVTAGGQSPEDIKLCCSFYTYLGHLLDGFSHEKTQKLHRQLFQKEVAEKTIDCLSQPENLLKKLYSALAPSAGSPELSPKSYAYYALNRKLKQAILASNLSQEAFFEEVRGDFRD